MSRSRHLHLRGVSRGLGDTYDPATNSFTESDIPAATAVQLEATAPGITAIVAQQQQPGQSWTDALKTALPIVAATYQQKQILDVQVQRAQQGLPPLDASQFAAGVNVGLSPQTLQYILLGAGGIALALFLGLHKKL